MRDVTHESVALEYYRAVCASLLRCIEDGGLIQLHTDIGEERTTVQFVIERELASRHFSALDAGRAD